MFTIPDKGEGDNDIQSIWFQEYLDILVDGLDGKNCVISGLAVTGGADMTPAVSSGSVISNYIKYDVTGADVTIGAADATNPRIDLIVVNSSGALAVRAGTAASAPKPPTRTANDVVLASVYVAANDTTIGTGCIDDKRVPLGGFEIDATNIYATTDAGNKGYIPVRHFIRANATRTFASNTNVQAIFDSPANGRLTLETGTYLFTGVLHVNTMSATSGNARFNPLGAGTATMGAVMYHIVGVDGAVNTAATQTGSTSNQAASPASALTAGTATVMTMNITGSFEITAAGTIIPSIQLVTANAAVLAIGSYLTFERIGTDSVVSVGQWD
jgi:hypothetical protein